jgi:hypothetical protein
MYNTLTDLSTVTNVFLKEGNDENTSPVQLNASQYIITGPDVNNEYLVNVFPKDGGSQQVTLRSYTKYTLYVGTLQTTFTTAPELSLVSEFLFDTTAFVNTFTDLTNVTNTLILEGSTDQGYKTLTYTKQYDTGTLTGQDPSFVFSLTDLLPINSIRLTLQITVDGVPAKSKELIVKTFAPAPSDLVEDYDGKNVYIIVPTTGIYDLWYINSVGNATLFGLDSAATNLGGGRIRYSTQDLQNPTNDTATPAPYIVDAIFFFVDPAGDQNGPFTNATPPTPPPEELVVVRTTERAAAIATRTAEIAAALAAGQTPPKPLSGGPPLNIPWVQSTDVPPATFAEAANFVVPAGFTKVRYTIIGPGGAGGKWTAGIPVGLTDPHGGGGGSGEVITGEITVKQDDVVVIVPGAGGKYSGASEFISITGEPSYITVDGTLVAFAQPGWDADDYGNSGPGGNGGYRSIPTDTTATVEAEDALAATDTAYAAWLAATTNVQNSITNLATVCPGLVGGGPVAGSTTNGNTGVNCSVTLNAITGVFERATGASGGSGMNSNPQYTLGRGGGDPIFALNPELANLEVDTNSADPAYTAFPASFKVDTQTPALPLYGSGGDGIYSGGGGEGKSGAIEILFMA